MYVCLLASVACVCVRSKVGDVANVMKAGREILSELISREGIVPALAGSACCQKEVELLIMDVKAMFGECFWPYLACQCHHRCSECCCWELPVTCSISLSSPQASFS